MEEDKKKKKNKKKKNKQAKQSDEPKANNGETKVSEQNHISDSQQNHTVQISKEDGAQSSRMLESDVKQGGDHSNGTIEANLDETEKRIWLQKEAALEERIRQLETYKDSCIEKEVFLENKISVLENENNLLLQKETNMDQQLKELLIEKANWTIKGAALDDRIKQLENDSESWILKENSRKETIDRLNKDYIEVQAQVKALEESRDGLLQENQELIEKVSSLQSQVQYLEEKRAFSASSTTEIEHVQSTAMDEDIAGNSLADKIITENVEKESSDQMVQLPTINTNIPKDTVSEIREILEEAPAVVVDNLEDKRSRGSYETDEIVQIPLDETEIREVEVENAEEDEGSVALTEAPLTGAPFRFISFVARYVSGADLVNK